MNIGSTLSEIVFSGNETFKKFLSTTDATMTKFKPVSEADVLAIINKMKNQRVQLSNKLIKYIKSEISKPLTLIINQSLTTGIFPSSLKIAKIKPLHKRCDFDVLNNYRPISLLPTMSKIFEK